MIRHAKLSEIAEILSITKACARVMRSKGINQWNEHYPNRAVFLQDLKRNELFALLKDDKLIGVIVISTIMDDEYAPIEWLTENTDNQYIHRLCVHPNFQGLGHAKRLMDFAEEIARKNQFKSIRLDTFSQNKRNQQFYEARGYQRLGDIYFPKQSKHPFHCYELVLS